MTSDEIRAAYLGFFESKAHKIIPSSPLIPQGDPTLLLTTAGMVQFKPYFLGIAKPPAPRLTSCQKCFRTTDIESVGDATHLTFFEMLGNFSIGEYFKKEAIAWAWEFVTGHLSLPIDRLWITVYLDDDEAFGYWREQGVAAERIIRLGESSNFWGPAGDSGPCGPCSEIHYDLGEDIGCGESTCTPGCDCGRFSEIWNLVFTQYNQDKNGKRTPLPRPNIDTGMGLERATAIKQGKKTVYDTDLFTELLATVSQLSGKKYGASEEIDHAMRVTVEHSRGIPFLIADGVMPSNEGRGYVLRRLLRRGALFGRRLGLDKPFLSETAQTTIEKMGHVYPELVQRQDFILKLIGLEEAKFSETLSTGLELLDGIINESTRKGGRVVSGEDAFKLYDTYGFPVELTREIASSRGFSVDEEGFNRQMEGQREKARASHKFVLAEKGGSGVVDIKPTKFVGYEGLSHKSSVAALLVGDEKVSTIRAGQEASVILEATPFYGEMGGQVGDTGEIRGEKGHFLVTNTIRVETGLPTATIVHQGRVIEGKLTVGDTVEAEVDKERRSDIARNHTATHLLQAALREVLGEHVQQRGSLVAPDQLRFDFSHLTPMTPEQIVRVNRAVNDKVRQNMPVFSEEKPYKQALEQGVIALFGEKYGDVVRVLTVGKPPISAELCGGTHIEATGEIGFFRITNESSIGAGLRRIEAVTGWGAEAYIEKQFAEKQKIAEIAGATSADVVDKVADIAGALETERKRAGALERELAKMRAESLLTRVQEVDGIRVLAEQVEPTGIDTLREMSDILRDKLGRAVVVLATVWEDKPAFVANVAAPLVAEGYDAGKIIREVAKVAGGSGGGKKTLAQGGGKDKDKIEEALKLVVKLVQTRTG